MTASCVRKDLTSSMRSQRRSSAGSADRCGSTCRPSRSGVSSGTPSTVTARGGNETSWRRIDRHGRIKPFTDAPHHPAAQPNRAHRARRPSRADGARIDRTLEDTLLYARSVLRTRLLAREVHLIHESPSWIVSPLGRSIPCCRFACRESSGNRCCTAIGRTRILENATSPP
jgi:hypothetical protein